MQHITDIHARNSRMIQIIDELSAGCDDDFDAGQEELEREFAELRLLCSAFDRR
jgi:hypothetical protein